MSAKSAVTQESTNGCGRMGAAVRGKLRAQTLAVALSVTMGFIGLAVPAYATDGSGNEGAPSVVTGEQKPVSITVNGETDSYDTILEALQATDGATNRLITLNNDVTDGIGFEVRTGTDLTIDLRGHQADVYDSITVHGDLTVMDSTNPNIEVVNSDGTINQSEYTGGILSLDGQEGEYASIKVQNAGTLTLQSGVIRSAYSGCVSVESGEKFTMNGGFVAAHDGYAVEVNDGAAFELNGGIVWSENYTAISGDNAIHKGDTSITINNGKVYSVNTNLEDEDKLVGVGVCEVMDGESTLTITGGEIRSFNAGVAVIVNKGTFEITDGQLYGAGKGFTGQTAHGIQVDNGYALMLNKVNAASTIKGGFFSADDEVPSLCISEGFVSLMSLDPDGKGVSIQGGTYTNPSGIDDYIDSGYYKLGHSLESRSAWATVLYGSQTPAVDNTQKSQGNIPLREAHVYSGQLDYYKSAGTSSYSYNYLDKPETTQSESRGGQYYVDYPTLNNYVFAGWFSDENCKKGVGSEVIEKDDAFAKMVDKNLQRPIIQPGNNLYDGVETNNEETSVRLLSMVFGDTIDCAGVDIERGQGQESWGLGYGLPKLVSTDPDTGATNTYPANYFVLTSEAFVGIKFTVGAAQFDYDLYCSPWWITLDGTRVSTFSSKISVIDYLERQGVDLDEGVGVAESVR